MNNTDIERNAVIIEEWTGTWCYDCPAAANGLEEVAEAGFNVGIIAYHNTDDYSTGNDIRMSSFYGRSWLPSVGFNGVFAPQCDGGANESCYDVYEPFILEQMQMKSPYDVSFSHLLLDGENFSGTVKINYPGFSYANDVRLIVAITESDIEESWQGLSHVSFVERGMFPDVNGTIINLEQNEETEVEVNFQIDPSWITENMQMIAFLQDFDSKEIFNGATSPVQTVGVDESFVKQQIELFPNPATDIVSIQSSENLQMIQVFNQAGQLLNELIPLKNNHQLDLSNYTNGIYFIRIKTANTVSNKKLIIK